MTSFLIVLVLLVPIFLGLQRTHARHNGPHARLTGSSDVEDRDLSRTRADLLAADHHRANNAAAVPMPITLPVRCDKKAGCRANPATLR
ncbi:hypothetical protein [Amycolatopsis sp.]|uniref:hypothetical protein n=1 Tax=Amycolatopsis sp. TaxID=37632 RepID=UPI0026393E32|nr:hypothetical protein [Amycolatopsis sp.]